MPVNLEWKPNNIIYIKLHGEITSEDIRHASETAVDMAEASGTLMVHNLVDLTEIDSLPLSLQQMKSAISAERRCTKLGWVLVITRSSEWRNVLQFVVAALSQMFNFRFRMFLNLAEVEGFLQEMEAV